MFWLAVALVGTAAAAVRLSRKPATTASAGSSPVFVPGLTVALNTPKGFLFDPDTQAFVPGVEYMFGVWDHASFDRDRAAQCFDGPVSTKMVDGVPILLKWPSEQQPDYLLDGRGRWYSRDWVRSSLLPWIQGPPGYAAGDGYPWSPRDKCYLRSGPPCVENCSSEGSFLERATLFAVRVIGPLVAAAVGFVNPPAGLVLGVTFAAMTRLSAGASLTRVAVEALADNIANGGGGTRGKEQFLESFDKITRGMSVDALRKLRDAIPALSQGYFNEGLAAGVAKMSQQAGVAALTARYPAHAKVIAEAVSWGGSVYNVAGAIGGNDAVAAVGKKFDEVQQRYKRLGTR